MSSNQIPPMPEISWVGYDHEKQVVCWGTVRIGCLEPMRKNQRTKGGEKCWIFDPIWHFGKYRMGSKEKVIKWVEEVYLPRLWKAYFTKLTEDSGMYNLPRDQGPFHLR